MAETLQFTCPRCATEVGERFYGPCERCRVDLRATQRIEAKELDVTPYEPKMNVVPNQVAMKD
jgi:hypothetical protein